MFTTPSGLGQRRHVPIEEGQARDAVLLHAVGEIVHAMPLVADDVGLVGHIEFLELGDDRRDDSDL